MDGESNESNNGFNYCMEPSARGIQTTVTMFHLVLRGLRSGQLWNRDGDEDHEEARYQVFVLSVLKSKEKKMQVRLL